MSALPAPNDPSRESFGELTASLSAAYEQVKIARRVLAGLNPSVELSAFMQSAEADLVRAMVVASELEAESRGAMTPDRVISIAQHRSSLSHPA